MASSKSKFTKAFFVQFKKNPMERLKELGEKDVADLLQHESHLYYTTGKQNITDDMYDMIKDYLESINPSHPILKNVGSYVRDDDARKVKLPYYMGSLDKIKGDDSSLSNFKNTFKHSYIVSDKLDGNSALFVFKNDTAWLYSRGNGVHGQNISHLLPFISGIPPLIAGGDEVAIRGELIMSKYNFNQVKDKGANARNMVAGLVNSKVPNMDIAKRIVFIAYSLLSPQLAPSEQYALLKKKGFIVVDHTIVSQENLTFDNLSEILIKRREEGMYEIDGLVVSHNEFHEIVPNKNPTYAFAFKHLLSQQTAEVIVTQVEWNVSKDAYLKPVVIFEPVQLSGVMIKRATGFNAEYIKMHKIGPGARILITRSGDVIPYILKVITPVLSGQLPENVDYVWTESGKDIMVKDPTQNVEVDFKKLDAFFKTLEIKGVGPATARALYDAGFTSIKHIIEMTQDDIVKIPNLKNKSVLIPNIKAALDKLDCIVLMEASNTFGRGFGEKKLRSIIEAIPKITDNVYIPSMEELLNVPGVSNITATKFIIGLKSYHAFLKNLRGFACKDNINTKKQKVSSLTKLANQHIVFTGFRNKEWESKINEDGGTVSSSVTSKTTLLVAASDKASTKLDAARKKGIKVITKDEFEKEYIK